MSHLPNLASPPAAGAVESTGLEAGEAAWAFRLHSELGSSKEVKEPHPIFQTFLKSFHVGGKACPCGLDYTELKQFETLGIQMSKN